MTEKSIDKFQDVINMIDKELSKSRNIETEPIIDKVDMYFKMYLPNEIRGFFEKKAYSINYSLSFFSFDTPDSEFDRAKKDGLISLRNLITNVIEYIEENALENENKVKKERDASNLESNKIFIVHGHNKVMKNEVARFVEKLGLKSIILSERPNEGRTIISKFQEESQDIRYAIVLLSEDDQLENGQSRTRQNVIFELGYFIGRLGNSNVVLLKEGEPEIPSDLYGVLYQDYHEDSNDWKFKLASEMKTAGIHIDLNKII